MRPYARAAPVVALCLLLLTLSCAGKNPLPVTRSGVPVSDPATVELTNRARNLELSVATAGRTALALKQERIITAAQLADFDVVYDKAEALVQEAWNAVRAYEALAVSSNYETADGHLRLVSGILTELRAFLFRYEERKGGGP